jgi:hypothetical protein
MGRNRNIGNTGGSGVNTKIAKSKGAKERRKMGQNEKFKAKKLKKKLGFTKQEKVGHSNEKLADLAVPLIQVGVGLLCLVICIFVLKNFVL